MTGHSPLLGADQEPRWRRMGPDARRNDIMSAAIRLFGERPYSEVSIGAVATEAGVARALVNHYCGTKRELYLKVIRLIVTPPKREELEFTTRGSLEERVHMAVEWLMSVIESYGPAWVRLSGAEGFGADPAVQKIIKEADDRAADLVLEAVGYSGAPDERRAIHVAIVCFGSLAKAVAREWIERRRITRDAARAILSPTLLALLNPT